MGNNHALWFDKSKRKILAIAFEDYYIKKVSKAISKIDITVNDAIGFCLDCQKSICKSHLSLHKLHIIFICVVLYYIYYFTLKIASCQHLF